MSMETREWLNQYILVGNCAKRPNAWHDDPELRRVLGLPSNHFAEPVPYKVVVERLFNWKAKAVPTANLIPCTKRDANYFLPEDVSIGGKTLKAGTPVRLSVSTRQGIVRDDTDAELGSHGAGYRIHDYEKWLLQLQSNVIGDSLSILGAGLLRNGAQAFVQVALPETVFDDSTGFDFWPYIMASTSLDGSIPTTFGAQNLFVVCDNTRNIALRQSESSGRIYKAKHTSGSLDVGRIKDVRQSLGIIHRTADNMIAELHELAAIKVTPRQWVKVMDIIYPMPDPADSPSKISVTRRENMREVLNHTYHRDPMCRDYKGTALGAVHAFNTFETHYRTVQGNRVERNLEKVITGKIGDHDQLVIKAVAEATNHPELVSAN